MWNMRESFVSIFTFAKETRHMNSSGKNNIYLYITPYMIPSSTKQSRLAKRCLHQFVLVWFTRAQIRNGPRLGFRFFLASQQALFEGTLRNSVEIYQTVVKFLYVQVFLHSGTNKVYDSSSMFHGLSKQLMRGCKRTRHG